MKGFWTRFWSIVDSLLESLEPEVQIVLFATLLITGYFIRWAVERHTLEYQHRQKINEILTEKQHEYSVKHYGPTLNLIARLCHSLRILVDHIENTENNEQSGARVDQKNLNSIQNLTYLQPLGQIFAILKKNRKSNVYFLRSLRGEEVVCFILDRFVETVTSERCLTRALCTQVLDEETAEDAADFFQQPLTLAVDESIKKFSTWAHQHRREVVELRRRLLCFRAALLFEINESHRGWYRRKQKIELDWDALYELGLLLKKLEEEKALQGRRVKLWNIAVRKAYMYRASGFRGLLPLRQLRKKAKLGIA